MRTQFAHDLRLARRKAGYTQADVAHLLAASQSLVSDLEQGNWRPTLDQIIDLSLIYGRSFETFFGDLLTRRQKVLRRRLKRLSKTAQNSVHTFNRDRSLTQLRKRLDSQINHGSA